MDKLLANLNLPMPHVARIQLPNERVFQSLRAHVQAIEKSLAPGEDIMGILVAHGGNSIAINEIRQDDQVIIFIGVDSLDREVRLVQHFTQVSVLLVKEKAKREDRKPIGFVHA